MLFCKHEDCREKHAAQCRSKNRISHIKETVKSHSVCFTRTRSPESNQQPLCGPKPFESLFFFEIIFSVTLKLGKRAIQGRSCVELRYEPAPRDQPPSSNLTLVIKNKTIIR